MKITLMQSGRIVQEEIVYCAPEQQQQQQQVQQVQQQHGTISRSMRNAFITISYGSGGLASRPSSAAGQHSVTDSWQQSDFWRRGSQESLHWRQPISAAGAAAISIDDSSGRRPIGSESTDDSSPGHVMFRSVQVEPPPDLLQLQPAGSLHSNSIVVRPTPCRPVAAAAAAATGSVNDLMEASFSPTTAAAALASGSRRRNSTASAAATAAGGRLRSGRQLVSGSDSGFSQEEPPGGCPADCCCGSGQGASVADKDHSRSSSSSGSSSRPSPVGAAGKCCQEEMQQLREREVELALLRRTMEQNEAALLRVFEERRTELEDRLRAELSLNSRLAPGLSHANRRLRQCEQLIGDLRLQAQLQSGELRAARSRVRRLEAELQAQTERARSLEASLAASGESLEAAALELLQLRHKQPAGSADEACQTDESESAVAAAAAEAAKLADKLEATERLLQCAEERIKENASVFDLERSQWLEEKCKVVAYQRQLQANQHQLIANCRQLEGEVVRLSELLEAVQARNARPK